MDGSRRPDLLGWCAPGTLGNLIVVNDSRLKVSLCVGIAVGCDEWMDPVVQIFLVGVPQLEVCDLFHK